MELTKQQLEEFENSKDGDFSTNAHNMMHAFDWDKPLTEKQVKIYFNDERRAGNYNSKEDYDEHISRTKFEIKLYEKLGWKYKGFFDGLNVDMIGEIAHLKRLKNGLCRI